MNKNKAPILLTLLLLTSSNIGQQRINLPPEAQSLRTFTEVKGQPEYLPSSFEFSPSGYKYRISSSGRGRRTGSGIIPRSFNLRLDKGDSLERSIYHAGYQGDILLLCEVSDGDGGAGFITRLDGQTLRMKWKRWIPAFNTGQGLIENYFAYVTAHGFVGKVNLKSGAFVWKHDNLFRDGDTFNVFEPPRIEGEAVLFKENTIYNPPAKTIKVHKQSGKIISIS
jgi:hypothetical protein